MKDIFHSFLILFILQIECCTSQNRYCQEAVDSVTVVDSCPTSKAEWDVAARMKDCSRIASEQNCTTAEKFQYHCVINGYRNVTLQVCAPTRIIFGHCVEFNVRGGVIQDQLSAPCNATFPKCDEFYISSNAYKYPDCYQLVSNSDSKHVSRTTTHTNISISTSTGPTPTDTPYSLLVIILLVSILTIIIIAVIVIFVSRPEKRTQNMSSLFKSNHQNQVEMTKISGGVMQNPVKQNHKEDASKAKFDDIGVLQPDSSHKEDASHAQSDCPGVLQPDSNSLISEVSTGIKSVALSSSASSFYDDQEDRELVYSPPVKEDDHTITERHM